jgi:hypothetical protein
MQNNSIKHSSKDAARGECCGQALEVRDTCEEAHIVYYVFFRPYEEAKIKKGKERAKGAGIYVRSACSVFSQP